MSGQKISTRDVLKVFGSSGVVVASLVFPNLPIAIGAVIKAWREVNKRELGIIVRRLQKQQMLSIKEKGDKVSIEITDKGKRRLLEYDFQNIKIKAKRRDNKWRLIIFDIPENKKINRDAFRKKLLELGCIRIQDSVFVCAYPCKNEVDFLCNFLEISDFVSMVTIDKFERGEELIFKRKYKSE